MDTAMMDRITLSDLACVVRSAFHPIRILRLAKGYTLRYLAKVTGLTWMTIHFIEIQCQPNRKTNNPKPETVYKLAKALGVNPAELYISCLEYNMEQVSHASKKTIRIVAKKGETPNQMLARLVHRQLHPFNLYLNKLDKSAASFLDEINVSRATLKNWLDMKNIPSIKTLRKVSNGFGLTLDDLLYGIEEWSKEDLSDPIGYIERNINRLEN